MTQAAPISPDLGIDQVQGPQRIPAQRTAEARALLTLARTRPQDAAVLRLWLLTRAAVFLTVSAGAWLVTAASHPTHPIPYLARWSRWDTGLYVAIAHWGYGGDPANPAGVPLDAFFPGFPLAMRLLHADTGIDYLVAGLLISFVAGGIAVVALARIAELEAGPDIPAGRLGERTVLLFLLAPSAIFLAGAYTEALFLACALPAWLMAKRGRWVPATLLAAGACAVRPTGLFFAAALIVEFLAARDGRRVWRLAPTLVVPFLPFLALTAYQHQRTGDWERWHHAEREGWYKVFAWPWEGLRHALDAVNSGQYTADWAWMYRGEIIAAAVGVILTGWLLRHRRWGEATFVGLQVFTSITVYWWMSIPRFTLTWWPLWIALAAWTLRRPAALHAYLAILAPFMILFTLAFSTGRWAG
jgi:mannosyltransferase PIG-V